MATRRDRGRLGAVSATLSAGALVFFAANPASAATARPAAKSDCLPLLSLVCGILGQGGSTSSPPPKSSGGGGTASKPSSAPKPKPKPKPKPPAARPHAPAHHASGGGSAGGAGEAPPLPAGDAPTIPAPQTAQGPALPDVTSQDPLVVPEAAPGGPPSARLVADSTPDGDTIPPLLVATASGLVGAVAALNLSVLRRRRAG